jgi:hypothetical protein
MPAVKSLHQEGGGNSKKEYIMGQYFECLSLRVGCAHQYFAMPLMSRIHDGVFPRCVITIGAYTYHFWMKAMKKIKIGSHSQHVYKEDELYREQVKRKLKAYTLFVQLGLITQGLLIYLALNFKNQVWKNFNSWHRTSNTDRHPSELVVATALRSTLWKYLLDLPLSHLLLFSFSCWVGVKSSIQPLTVFKSITLQRTIKLENIIIISHQFIK